MAEIKKKKDKYINSNALSNVINYYAYSGESGTNWECWGAFGVNATDLDLALANMMDTKVMYNQMGGIQLHQIHVYLTYEEIDKMNINNVPNIENQIACTIGNYIWTSGFQCVCFMYRTKKNIFLRYILNSVSVKMGQIVTNINPLIAELSQLINGL